MFIKNLSAKIILALSLLILVMGLSSCGTLEAGALPKETDTTSSSDSGATNAGNEKVSGIEVGIEPTPTPEHFTYANNEYGFAFDYPGTWTLTEEDHRVVLMQGTNRLAINFRWVNETFNFGRTGFPAGTPIYSDKVMFLGKLIPENIVELDGQAKYVVYSDMARFDIDDLTFMIVLEDLESDYMKLELPKEVIAEAKSILETFQRIPASGSNPPVPAPTQAPTPAPTPVIETDMSVYENTEYGFRFQYPSQMSVEEEPNKVLIRYGGGVLLTIAYRRADEDIQLAEVGQLSGQFHPYLDVNFLGQPVQTMLNVQDGLIKAAYLDGPGVEVGLDTPLRFVVSLEITDGDRIANAQVDQMLAIAVRFELIK